LERSDKDYLIELVVKKFHMPSSSDSFSSQVRVQKSSKRTPSIGGVPVTAVEVDHIDQVKRYLDDWLTIPHDSSFSAELPASYCIMPPAINTSR